MTRGGHSRGHRGSSSVRIEGTGYRRHRRSSRRNPAGRVCESGARKHGAARQCAHLNPCRSLGMSGWWRVYLWRVTLERAVTPKIEWCKRASESVIASTVPPLMLIFRRDVTCAYLLKQQSREDFHASSQAYSRDNATLWHARTINRSGSFCSENTGEPCANSNAKSADPTSIRLWFMRPAAAWTAQIESRMLARWTFLTMTVVTIKDTARQSCFSRT